MNRQVCWRLRGRRTATRYRPSAFTLIEILLVLVLISSLLGGTVGVLSVVRRSREQAITNMLMRAEIRRFADDFRRDARLSDDVMLGPRSTTSASTVIEDPANDRAVLIDRQSGRRVTFSVRSDSSIIRIVSLAEQADVSRDHYMVGKMATIEFRHLHPINALQCTITPSEGLPEPIQILAPMGEPQ